MSLNQLALIKRVIGRRRPPEEPAYGEFAQSYNEIAAWIGGDAFPNPDTLVQDAGDYSVYKNMALDPVVRLAINHRSSRIIGETYDVVCKDTEIAEYCEESIRNHLGDRFQAALADWIDWAITTGFCLMEPLWDQNSKGEAFCFELKPKDPDLVEFQVDPYFNIKNILFKQGGMGLPVPIRRPDKFMLLAFEKNKYGPYGRSMLRSAYTHYRGRLSLLKSAVVYAERGAYPVIIGWHPPGFNNTDRNALMTNIMRMHRKSAMLVRNDVNITPLPLDNVNPAHFIQLLDHFARNIWAGVLGGWLSVGEGTASASRSAGDHHEDNIERNERKDCKLVQDAVSKYLLFDLARFKFGSERVIKTPPHLKITPSPSHDVLQLGNLAIQLVQLGFVLDEKFWTNRLGMPENMTIPPQILPGAMPLQLGAGGKGLNPTTAGKENMRMSSKNNPQQVRSDQAQGMK